jgi:hypothetical protein
MLACPKIRRIPRQPRNEMIIVCLDQCAISALARSSTTGGAIGELRKTLLDASEKLKLICPVAPETIVETTGLKSSEHRILMYELHSALADARLGGPVWSFKSMWKMIKEETLALARCELPPSAFELIRWSRIDEDELAAETWRGVVEAKQGMLERVQSHPLTPVEGTPTLKATSAGIVLEHVAHAYRQIERLLAGEALDPKDHMGYEVAQYLQEKGVTKTQLEKLVQDILCYRWENIPVIYNRTQLAGQLEADYRSAGNPRNYNVNDELDIPRLAVGLSSADVIITDAAMAQICHTLKTNRWTETKVFAVRDAEEFLAYLESALAGT